MKGTCDMKQNVSAEGTNLDIVMKMNISSSIDVDEFNMVESVDGSQYVQNGTHPWIKNKFTLDQILNFNQGVVTQHMSVAGQDPTCRVMKLPPFVAAHPIRFKRVLRMVMKAMEKGYNCAGNANGMDTYAMDFPPSWLPVHSPVEVHTTLDVDQDFLVHKETVKEDIDMKGTKAHVESTFVSDETLAGGPTEDEMTVPDSWGPCEEHLLDIDEMLKPFAEDIDRAQIMRAVGAFRKILHAVRFSELSMHSETVV